MPLSEKSWLAAGVEQDASSSLSPVPTASCGLASSTYHICFELSLLGPKS